jgi:uncharacterized RDD family membrane protein YckC
MAPEPRTPVPAAAAHDVPTPPGRQEAPRERGRPLMPLRRAPRPASAPLGSRVVAGLVDAVFVVSGQAALLTPVAWYWWFRETPTVPSDVAFVPVLASATLVPLALVLGALYHVYFWSVKGATPGKELLGLRVETEDGATPLPLGRAALRAFAYLLSAASLGIGFAMIAFGGVGLHDRIAGTRVVQGPRR